MEGNDAWAFNMVDAEGAADNEFDSWCMADAEYIKDLVENAQAVLAQQRPDTQT